MFKSVSVAHRNIYYSIEIFINEYYNYKIVTNSFVTLIKMKTKIFLGILLTTILLAITASAANLVDVSKGTDFSKSANESYFEIKNVAGETLNLNITASSVELKDNDNRKLAVSFTAFPASIAAGETKKVTASISKDADFDFNDLKLGSHLLSAITITAENATNSSINEVEPTLNFYFVNGFCKYGETGKLEITELKDKEADNEDSFEWHPLDDVEFSVEVYNDFDDKEKISIEYELRDANGKRVDLDEDNSEQSISIEDGDSEKVTFGLRVPADIDDGTYKMFIKAFVKSDESEGCVDKSSEFEQTYFQEVRIDREEDRAVVVDTDNLEIQDSTKCGETSLVTAKIYNIGTEEEEKVKVTLYNKVLGVDLAEVVNNLDEGESATVTFSFKVPENVEGKNYPFSLMTYYEYDEDNDEYDSDSKSDLDKNFDFDMKIDCVKETIPVQSASITAELENDAVAGEPLVIKGTLKNTGKEDTTYLLSVSGYNSWAGLENIEPSTISLKAGESKDFEITLNLDETAEGEQLFTVKASYNGKVTEQQVSIEAAAPTTQTNKITGAVISENLRKNWFIWVIVVINIILIIAIIAVARRIVKSR